MSNQGNVGEFLAEQDRLEHQHTIEGLSNFIAGSSSSRLISDRNANQASSVGEMKRKEKKMTVSDITGIEFIAIEVMLEEEPELGQWTRPYASREDVELELSNMKNDGFLIRPSSRGHSTLCISFKNGKDGRILHYIVERSDDKYHFPSRPNDLYEKFTALLESIDLWPIIVTGNAPVIYEKLPADLHVEDDTDSDFDDEEINDQRKIVYGKLPGESKVVRKGDVEAELVDRTIEAALTTAWTEAFEQSSSQLSTGRAQKPPIPLSSPPRSRPAEQKQQKRRKQPEPQEQHKVDEFPTQPTRTAPKPSQTQRQTRARASSDPIGVEEDSAEALFVSAPSTPSMKAVRANIATPLLAHGDDDHVYRKETQKRVDIIHGLRVLFSIVLFVSLAGIPFPIQAQPNKFGLFQVRGVVWSVFVLFSLEGFELQVRGLRTRFRLRHGKRRWMISHLLLLAPVYVTTLAMCSFLLKFWGSDGQHELFVTILSGVSCVFGLQAWTPYTAIFWSPVHFIMGATMLCVVLFPFTYPLIASWTARGSHSIVCIVLVLVFMLLQAVIALARAVSSARVSHEWYSGVVIGDIWSVGVLTWPPFASMVVFGAIATSHSGARISRGSKAPFPALLGVFEVLLYISYLLCMVLLPPAVSESDTLMSPFSLSGFHGAMSAFVGPVLIWPAVWLSLYGGKYAIVGRVLSIDVVAYVMRLSRSFMLLTPYALIRYLFADDVVELLSLPGYLLLGFFGTFVIAALHHLLLHPCRRWQEKYSKGSESSEHLLATD